MNKKFSTLVAGFLLAGGLFTNVIAQDAVLSPILGIAAGTGDYYAVKVNKDAEAEWGTSWNMTVVSGELTLEQVMDAPKTAAAEWTVSEVKVNGSVMGFALTNGEGVKLTFDEDGKFAANGKGVYSIFKIDNDGYLYPVNSEKLKLTQGTGDKLSLQTTGSDLKLFTIPANVYSVKELNNILGEGFGLQICAETLKNNDTEVDPGKEYLYDALQGNPFTGVLTAKGSTENDEQVALYQANGNRIVLTTNTWGSQAGGTTQVGYKFASLTNKEYKKALKDDKVYADKFQITSPSLAAQKPLEVIAVAKDASDDDMELVVTIIDGVNRLTVDENAAEKEAEYTFGWTNDNNVGKDAKENTYVRFGLTNLIDYSVFYDKLLNITRTKVGEATTSAAPACKEFWAPVAQVALDQPEGQWLYQGDASFINRESGNVVTVASLRETDKEDVYEGLDGYTYTIKAVGTPGDTENGYFAKYSADQLKQKAFYIGTPIASTEDTVYMVNKDGKIAWTLDKNEAIQFRFSKVIFGAEPKTDKIKHYTTYLGLNKDKEVVEKVDTLNFYRYNLAEVATGKTLGFDAVNKVFALGNAAEEENNTAWNVYSVVLKNKATDLYNILTEIDGDVLESVAKDGETGFGKATAAQWMTKADAFCGSNNSATKLYGAHNSNSLVKAQSAYNFVENDIFVITDADADMYRPVASLDTIKIYRNEDNNYVLYETGKLLADAKDEAIAGFLGIQNFLDPKYAEKNAAMLADTAAGQGTWRPEYMLALDAAVVPEGNYCPIHGVNATCEHATPVAGWTEGRYLVNLVDSVKAGRTDCSYQDLNGTTYYRLGFVQAKHAGDSLIIASVAPTKADTINLTDNTIDKVCTFAFRYIDATRDAFRIETAYNVTRDADGDVEKTSRGWIKYHNGIPVVTSNVSDAEVFDLEETDEAPTANEDVEVSEVSIIAANGSVIVKGAAGKTVAISNILGQTIANAVVSSDNETIAVPAGIAVVAVEGEEAVKVVVK